MIKSSESITNKPVEPISVEAGWLATDGVWIASHASQGVFNLFACVVFCEYVDHSHIVDVLLIGA